MKPKCYKTLSNRWHRVDSVVVKFMEVEWGKPSLEG